MLLTFLVLGYLLFAASLTANILLYKAGERQLNRAEIYEQLYREYVAMTKQRVLETYLQMKELDNVNGNEGVFSKDDEVGVAFREMLSLLQQLNELTQEEEE